MRIIWLFALVIVYVPLILLISVNWHDEKVRDIGFSVLLVGGVIGLISVWNSLKTEKNSIEFYSSIVVLKDNPSISIGSFINSESLQDSSKAGPLVPEDYSFSTASREYFKAFPAEFKADVWKAHRDVLTYLVVEELVKTFSGHWLVDVKSSEMEMGKISTAKQINGNLPTEKITWSELKRTVAIPIFQVESLGKVGEAFSMNVPPGTRLFFNDKTDEVVITLQNRLSTVEIHASFTMYAEGFGRTGAYLAIPQSSKENFLNLTYKVEIKCEVNKLYSGSEYAANLRVWTHSIQNVLQEKLDFSLYIERLRERQFYKM